MLVPCVVPDLCLSSESVEIKNMYDYYITMMYYFDTPRMSEHYSLIIMYIEKAIVYTKLHRLCRGSAAELEIKLINLSMRLTKLQITTPYLHISFILQHRSRFTFYIPYLFLPIGLTRTYGVAVCNTYPSAVGVNILFGRFRSEWTI